MASPDKDKWLKAVEDEYQRFMKLKVFTPISRHLSPSWATIRSTVWAYKRKASGVYRARLNMRGFEQIPHVHYQPEWTSAPVTSASTIRIMLVIMLMRGGYAHIIDVCSAFLFGLFGEHEPKLYANIPKGWEHNTSFQ